MGWTIFDPFFNLGSDLGCFLFRLGRSFHNIKTTFLFQSVSNASLADLVDFVLLRIAMTQYGSKNIVGGEAEGREQAAGT